MRNERLDLHLIIGSVSLTLFSILIAILLSSCTYSGPVEEEGPGDTGMGESFEKMSEKKDDKMSEKEAPVKDRSLEASVRILLDQVERARGDNKLFPSVWGVTPIVRKVSTQMPFEDGRTLKITGQVEEALIADQGAGEVPYTLVQLKEMERLLGEQRKQFSDLYSDEDDGVAAGELVRAQAFLFGTITGAQGEDLALELVDATTRHKYAQVSAKLPPDATPPPPPMSLCVKLRAEPVEGQERSTPARDLYEGSTVYSGEGMVIFANLSEAAYLYVFVRFSQGDVIPVFPAIEGSVFYAPHAPRNPLSAGKEISIPSTEFSYVWDDHPGAELVLFVASRTPLADLDACVRQLVENADMTTSKNVWDGTLASAYLTRGIAGVVKKKNTTQGPSSEIVFKSQGHFVGGSILLHHE